MKAKSKLRKKNVTRKITRTNSLVLNLSLVSKLRRSAIPMTVIASKLGYKSHNTIKHWFVTGKLPSHQVKAITKILGSK